MEPQQYQKKKSCSRADGLKGHSWTYKCGEYNYTPENIVQQEQGDHELWFGILEQLEKDI